VIASVLILGLCCVSAVYLYRQQAAAMGILQTRQANYTVTRQLETELRQLVAMLEGGGDQHPVAALDRLDNILAVSRAISDPGEERELAEQLRARFDVVRGKWQAAHKAPASPAVADVVGDMRRGMIPICRRLEDLDFAQVEESERALARSTQLMAWGLGAVGVIGSLAALLVGYSAASGVRRSLHRLSVHVQGAREKLTRGLPAVTLEVDQGFDRLHEQLKGLTGEIEQVVGRLQLREREVLRAEQLAAVGQVAAGVAHELRNPLTSIKLLVYAKRQESEAWGLPGEDFRVIEQEIRRMEQCLQTFLDFARPPKAVRRPIDPGPLVERALTLIGGRARKQNVSVALTRPDAPTLVEADGEQLVQVLINLTLNALDAMPRGGRLDVELSDGEGQVRLRVLDTGPGIAPEVLPRLFEPFVSAKETGLGLGLAIAQRIAEGHGGELRAGNRPGGGACFELSLPAYPAPREGTA
jgi:signal transduction histidine kinase